MSLKKLAEYFENPVYIVGGAVRNEMLGYPVSDIDICGAAAPEEVINKLTGTEFFVKTASDKLFTLIITDGTEKYEYTAFRTDSYRTGIHTPYESKRADSLETDALRRDFTVNAIYREILSGKICDPLGGLTDLKNRLLRSVNPEKVLAEDGLRLMRLARIAAETGFEIEEATLEAAKRNAHLIKDIACERIREELDKILLADQKYGVPKAHARGLRLLDETGVLQYIIPELTAGKGVEQRKDFHKYDVFTHIMKAVEAAENCVRLAALFHDIAKPKCLAENGTMRGHDKTGEIMTRAIMTRLRYSNERIETVSRLVALHMYDLTCEAKESTLRAFIQSNHKLVPFIIKLKRADSIGRGMGESSNPSAARMEAVYNKMLSEGIPMTVADLAVTGNDLIEAGIPEKSRSEVLKRLLNETKCGGAMLERENQLKFIKNARFNK